MVDATPTLRWGIERRMAFLDGCLFWFGHVNRAELVRRFGISVPQASADLARYRELAPGNLLYDSSRKAYVRGEGFQPVYEPPSVDNVLDGLESVAAGAPVPPRQPWLEGIAVARVSPIARRNIEAETLRRLLAAIRDGVALRVAYQSFSRPEPSLRWMEPHAMAHDGERWHVRAFCDEHRDFRDFVLSRIFEITDERPARAPRQADFGWESEVVLRLAPNPRLPDGIRRSIELDHRMRHGVTLMRLRICFVYYVERRFNLDLDPATFDPRRCQLVLMNRDEVQRAMTRAADRMRAAVDEADAYRKAPLSNRDDL